MDPDGIEIVPGAAELRPLVRRYMYADRRLDAPLVIRPKPTGYAYLVHFPRPPVSSHVLVDGQAIPLHSRWHIAGQIVDHDIAVRHIGRHQALYCELGASAQHRLFGVPGEATTGKGPSLGDVAANVEALAREHFTLGPDATRDEHIAQANAFFLALTPGAAPGEPLVEEAVRLCEAAHGAVRIADICQELDVDPRQLNRRFNHIVGVSPKFFCQALQINWVVGMLYSNDTVTLTQMAHEAGFHDQAHFHRAMRRFFDEGPREFLRSDHVLFKAFLGTSRRFGPAAPE